jgi:hypothetical protein
VGYLLPQLENLEKRRIIFQVTEERVLANMPCPFFLSLEKKPIKPANRADATSAEAGGGCGD